MCNRNRGSTLHQVIQCFLNFLLGLGIYRGSGLIQNQNTRIDEQGARNRNALALATGEALSALPYQRVIALGKSQNKFMRVRCTCCSNYVLSASVGFTVRNVVGNGAKEQERLLQYQADMATEI